MRTVACIAITSLQVALGLPTQVHLALGPSPDTISVEWATVESNESELCTTSTVVVWGETPDDLNSTANGECYPFSVSGQAIQSNHVAKMTGLKASTRLETSNENTFPNTFYNIPTPN